MVLADGMLSAGEFDYADWVSIKIADVARKNSVLDVCARAMRLAGVAASMMGRIFDIETYFNQAVNCLESISDSDISILIHMSYGLAIIEQFAHWEAESYHMSIQNNNKKRENLDTAKKNLQIAKEIIGNSVDEDSKRKLCAIELDLIRVRDLNGESESALQDLDTYFFGETFVHTDKLIATAILYRAFILKKLRDNQRISHSDYLDILNLGLQELGNLKLKPGDRFCCFLTLLGDALIEQGQFFEGLEKFMQAFAIQKTRGNVVIRTPTPHPNLDFVGLPSIDLAGRIQLVCLLLAQQEKDSSYVWEALHLADEVKGKYFRRNLTMTSYTNDSELRRSLSAHYEAIKGNLLSNQEDHRIIMAEYTRFLELELPPEKAKILKDNNASYELGVVEEELSELLRSDDYNVAYLSLYATKNETYLYLLSKPTTPNSLFCLKAFILQVSLTFLENVVTHLLVGIYGNTRYNEIDPNHPHEKDKLFFDTFAQLQKKLDPIVSELTEFEHIVISPHGIWHNLPIHALMLPTFWAGGFNPGITYSPSIHAFNLFGHRADAKKPFAHKLIGLVTVRAVEEENKEAEFAEAHAAFKSILGRTERSVVESYGYEATPEKVLDTLNQAGIMHILAHGSHEIEGNSIKSRLHLASKLGLPSKPVKDKEYQLEEALFGDAIMIGGTTAEHVTLQACSLGRTETAFGDELWGMTRALLAGGADSVLLPMWDVDIKSSTAIISQFYENWLMNKSPKWKALADAQLQVYKDQQHPSWSHFYHWGALQLVGI